MNAIELADDLEISSTCVEDHGTIAIRSKKAATMLRKQAKEIDYWKEMFEKAMSVNEQIKYLESQVYGGNTK